MVECRDQSDENDPVRWRRRDRLFALIAAMAVVLVGVWGLTQVNTPDVVVVPREPEGSASVADESPGEIRVRLEDVDGVFTEGFEVGLRFDTADEKVIASTLWSDFVESTGRSDIDSYYDSVLVQSVPAGTVRVSAEVNIGAGPGPSRPDLTAELPCVLVIEVDPGAVVVVEASFNDPANCLRRVPGEDEPAISTTTTRQQEGTASTVDVPAAEANPAEPTVLDVGSSHYVDVDIECQAFGLAGVWVLVEGDTTTWQPPGERHEGGMFTVERPGHGRFVGEANGDKFATFKLLPSAELPACTPVPRGAA